MRGLAVGLNFLVTHMANAGKGVCPARLPVGRVVARAADNTRVTLHTYQHTGPDEVVWCACRTDMPALVEHGPAQEHCGYEDIPWTSTSALAAVPTPGPHTDSHTSPATLPPCPAVPQPIVWFWQVVHGLDPHDQKRLLFFVTGSDRVPIKGLAALNPPFVISRAGGRRGCRAGMHVKVWRCVGCWLWTWV